MKKKLNIVEIAIAIIFVAATASAQKPNNIGKITKETYDYLTSKLS